MADRWMSLGDAATWEDSHRVDVFPLDDLIAHDTVGDCVCGPLIVFIAGDDGSDNWMHTHHSLDGREASE